MKTLTIIVAAIAAISLSSCKKKEEIVPPAKAPVASTEKPATPAAPKD